VGSERSFLFDGCKSGTRGDGRGCLDWRPISINTSVVASASGSARVQIGATDVIVGVKASQCSAACARRVGLDQMQWPCDTYYSTAQPRSAPTLAG
jgi:3' exoribonuclease family, domain 1